TSIHAARVSHSRKIIPERSGRSYSRLCPGTSTSSSTACSCPTHSARPHGQFVCGSSLESAQAALQKRFLGFNGAAGRRVCTLCETICFHSEFFLWLVIPSGPVYGLK